MAGGAIVGYPDLAKANPAADTPNKAVAFRHTAQHVGHLAVEGAEIARIQRDIDIGHLVQGPVEESVGAAFEQPFFALVPNGVHHLVALLPMRQQVRYFFGRVLQIGVHHHEDVAARVVDAGADRRLVPKVARKTNHTNVRIGGVQRSQDA